MGTGIAEKNREAAQPRKPSPKGWPRISAGIYYDDPASAIDWLCRAFGFEIRLKVEGEDGSVVHSELVYGDGLIMVGGTGKEGWRASPRSLAGKTTQSLMIYVDDVKAHCEHARAAGARVTTEPKVSDYGDEYWSDAAYGAEDIEGHQWWIVQRLRDPK